MKKKYYDAPDFELIKFCFEEMMDQRRASDPETSGDEASGFLPASFKALS